MRKCNMKKIVVLLLMLTLLAGCTDAPPPVTTVPGESTRPTETVTTVPTTEEATAVPVTEETTVPVTELPTAAPTEAETTAPYVPETTTAPTETTPSPADGLVVHFIDVGQADSALLEYDGHFALIDAGYPESGAKVVSYLKEQGVQKLDLVVATHPHGDHIGGLPAVLKAFKADNIWSSAITFFNSYINDFRNAARAQNQTIQEPKPGHIFWLGDAKITVIGPMRTNYEDTNDVSLVLMVEYGDTKFLFTGDMEREAELDLIASGVSLKADVLKVGHHGSYSSTSYVFLREVMPTYAVISVGAANDYGHPHEEPVSRLRDADVIIFRTDRMYTVVAYSDGQDIRFSWGNKYAKPWTPDGSTLENAA